MNTQTVSAFRQTYGSPGLAGLEGLVGPTLASTLLRYFASYLVFDKDDESPHFCYQLPPALASFVPHLALGPFRSGAVDESYSLDAANNLLLSAPYTVGFENIGHSLSSLLSISQHAFNYAHFDASVKSGIFGPTQPSSYPNELLHVERKLFSEDLEHCNIVVPIFSMGSWIAFVYLVVANKSLWIKFLQDNITFSLLLGEQISLCGVYESISRKEVSLKYKSELLRAAIANGGRRYLIQGSNWSISTDTEPQHATESIMILDIEGTRIALNGFPSRLDRLFKQIELDARANTTLRESRRSAARAAVFARNFSHVAGSHVVSNPEFRAALWAHGVGPCQREIREALDGFEKAETDYLSKGFFEAPDKLWRKGTDALCHADRALQQRMPLLEGTRRFHEYLQGRFDFIARGIDKTMDQPEPVFFVADLLEGFLRQTAYLDTFVADLGLRLKDMKFVVALPTNAVTNKAHSFTATVPEVPEKQREVVWTGEGDVRAHDVMVALPGGMIAAHAFYSLLENVIRNSCKYGMMKKHAMASDEKYKLTLTLSRAVGAEFFTLSIQDSFSYERTAGDTAQRVAEVLRDHLKADFIDTDNKPRKSGLGMLEMQACAEQLCVKCVDTLTGKAYPDFSGGADKTDASVRKNLQIPPTPDDKPIKFILALNAPVLLGLISVTALEGVRTISKCFRSPEEALYAGVGAHIMVVDGEAGDATLWMDQIISHVHALPYRLLIVCKKPERASALKLKLTATQQGRILVLDDGTLYAKLFEMSFTRDAETQHLLDAYAAWLRNWKQLPTNEKWELFVGIERAASQVKEAWEESLNSFKSDVVCVRVRSFQAGQPSDLWESGPENPGPWNEKAYWETELGAAYSEKRALVFDNHGNCFEGAKPAENSFDFRKSTRFYQKISGSLTPDLFQRLSRPPTDPFAFAFFIYSLVESCLTNVMIVDERLAWNLLAGDGSGDKPNDHFAEYLADHQKAGVFPVFSFRSGTTKVPQFTDRHQARLSEVYPTAEEEGEGVTVTDGGTVRTADLKVLSYRWNDKDKKSEAKVEAPEAMCDVLIVHEGAMDLLDGSGIDWKKEYADALFTIAPRVVRTSGRGRETRHLKREFPFIEFGEVSSAVLTSRNKYALARGLLGAAGEAKK